MFLAVKDVLLETHRQKKKKQTNNTTYIIPAWWPYCYNNVTMATGFVFIPTAISDQVAVFVINTKYGVSCD